MAFTNAASSHPSVYETDKMLQQYLLFHYGTLEDQLPFAFGPKHSLQFSVRCVTECLDVKALPKNARALDLGCSVGRSSFELARFCETVVGIDTSHVFIAAAKQMQQEGKVNFKLAMEGAKVVDRIAHRPHGIDANRIEFICTDASQIILETTVQGDKVMQDFKSESFVMVGDHSQLVKAPTIASDSELKDCVNLSPSTAVSRIIKAVKPFDVVLSANVLCRVAKPKDFLSHMRSLVAPGGQLILISPYSWLEEFTPRSNWLGSVTEAGSKSALQEIREILDDSFNLQRVFDMPFLMRQHLRKYDWGVSQATVWIRKS